MANTKLSQRRRQDARPLPLWLCLLGGLGVTIGFVSLFAALWYIDVCGDTGFDSILFTLQSSLGGVQSDLLVSFFVGALIPALLGASATNLLLFWRSGQKRKLKLPGDFLLNLPLLRRGVAMTLAIVLTLTMLLSAAGISGLFEYAADLLSESTLFEKYYADPDSVEITFPEEKRNLVYIMLESMEISYLSKELGGAMEHNLIPELHSLALEHTNFSHNKSVGGFHETSGASWTIGSIVAQTAGIPLKIPEGIEDWQNGYGKEGEFLPGVTTITNVLHDAGYHTTFLCGSDANFGGRKTYYMTHGMDRVYDIYTARKDGIVPKDYFVWWGMEDLYLFEYARQELTEISQQDQPFAFTMLTVDTHHIGGYQCEFCTDEYEESYDQSISCSSRQVLDFLRWLQEQPFWENTTVVITGDHCSMDREYFDRNVDEDYNRMVYNVIINAPLEPIREKNRTYCAMDLFPTTLAALGCRIEGNRLGLGTNLYSNVPTLAEKLGFQAFENEVSKSSDYYTDNFYEEDTAPTGLDPAE